MAATSTGDETGISHGYVIFWPENITGIRVMTTKNVRPKPGIMVNVWGIIPYPKKALFKNLFILFQVRELNYMELL